ncbi:hypothetical protein [Pseudonocardia sp. MH-G8]|uniref:hypothetical protein n=1 Tax=Pseudonocardia sp. MH-G8 TaxID=1854588 RepID=UPI000BA1120A|nr:hypothetical protein [Pseudonocardia sp. MH-G8]OZM76980.1 hypothetical protein CFP66_38140 [Pseudonocardia sp. MH-G8]
MTTPTPDEIEVALKDLEADATTWTNAAADLRVAAAAAERQRLDPAVFSFAGPAAAAEYEALRAKLASRISQGVAGFAAIAAALRASAAAYAADEAAGVHRMQNIY